MYSSSAGRTKESAADLETWDPSSLEPQAGSLAQSTESESPWRLQGPVAEKVQSTACKKSFSVKTLMCPWRLKENLGETLQGA